jgi:hypothetical protein
MPSRKIYWVTVHQQWFTAGTNPIVVQPSIGDVIDVMACDKIWEIALKRRNFSWLPIVGTEEFVQVVAKDHVQKQGKIAIRGFQKPKRRW